MVSASQWLYYLLGSVKLTIKKTMGYDFQHGQLAQSVEQGTENPCVRSSILRLPTIFTSSAVPNLLLYFHGK